MKNLFSLKIDLLGIIPKICDCTLSEKGTVPLIRLCIRLSFAQLRFMESKGYRIRESRSAGDDDLEHLATDSIAELFERNETGEFVQLRRYFTPHLKTVSSEEEWLVLLRRLVISRTRQSLTRIFRERDPEGARILRNLKASVANNPKCTLVEWLGSEWISLNSEFKNRRNLSESPCVVKDAVVLEPLYRRFQPKDTIPEILDTILDYMSENPEFPKFLDPMEIVRMIKKYRETFKIKETRSTDPDGFPETIRYKLEAIRHDLLNKIETGYVRTGKMDRKTADGIRRAVCDVIDDLIDTCPLRPYYHYIRDHFPDMDESLYRKTIRTKFEYFAKIIKNRIQKEVLFSED
jgi:hypothetical protein